MNGTSKPHLATHPSLKDQSPDPLAGLKNSLETWLRTVLHQELEEVLNGHGINRLLSPEELAQRLNLPVSWVYEQSRLGNIPTHRLGRYIRFNLHEVLASQKKE